MAGDNLEIEIKCTDKATKSIKNLDLISFYCLLIVVKTEIQTTN